MTLVGILKREGRIDHNGKTIRLEDVSVERKGQTFAFVMDTRVCEAAYSLAQGVDLLVTESTFLGQDEDKALAHGHLTATQAAEIARKARVGMLLLTHFSQRYGPKVDFTTEAREVFPDVKQMNDKDTYDLERPQIPLV
jgi:ribonuclease Z